MSEKLASLIVVVFFLGASAFFVLKAREDGLPRDVPVDDAKPEFSEPSEMRVYRSRLVADLKSKGVSDDRLINVFGRLPRHLFFGGGIGEKAYLNFPLSLSESRRALKPSDIAFNVQTVQPSSSDRVLEVGAAEGYKTAVLASLAGSVYSIEADQKIAENTRERLSQLGFSNIEVVVSDPVKGLLDHAPYDIIIVNLAVKDIPLHMSEQLAPDGVMMLPLVETDVYQRMTLITRINGSVSTREYGIVRLDPM